MPWSRMRALRLGGWPMIVARICSSVRSVVVSEGASGVVAVSLRTAAGAVAALAATAAARVGPTGAAVPDASALGSDAIAAVVAGALAGAGALGGASASGVLVGVDALAESPATATAAAPAAVVSASGSGVDQAGMRVDVASAPPTGWCELLWVACSIRTWTRQATTTRTVMIAVAAGASTVTGRVRPGWSAVVRWAPMAAVRAPAMTVRAGRTSRPNRNAVRT